MNWPKPLRKRSGPPHWVLVFLPPLLLIPIYFIFDPHGWVRTCSPFTPDYIAIPAIALLVGGLNVIRRLLFNRRDRRLYRSLLTVPICSGLLFHYSHLGEELDQFVIDLAEKVQAHCVAHGKCPDKIRDESQWSYVEVLQVPVFFYYFYHTDRSQERFCIDYCIDEDTRRMSWSGGAGVQLASTDANCEAFGETINYDDGSEYVGEMKNLIPHGQGTFTYWNGGTLVGNFDKALLNGQGTYTGVGGERFIGEWNYGEEWNGTFYRTDGTVAGTVLSGELILEKFDRLK